MKLSIDTAENIDEALNKVERLVSGLQQVDDLAKAIRFLTIDEVTELTGWSRAIVNQMFNMPEFPSCNYGKSKIVEIHALIEFFGRPRRR